MFEKTKRFVIKHERKIWVTAVLGTTVTAAWYGLRYSFTKFQLELVDLAAKEMNITEAVNNKITEMVMRDDF